MKNKLQTEFETGFQFSTKGDGGNQSFEVVRRFNNVNGKLITSANGKFVELKFIPSRKSHSFRPLLSGRIGMAHGVWYMPHPDVFLGL